MAKVNKPKAPAPPRMGEAAEKKAPVKKAEKKIEKKVEPVIESKEDKSGLPSALRTRGNDNAFKGGYKNK